MSHLAVRTFCIAAAGSVLSWLLLAGGSPLSSWLAGQPRVTNLASAINLPTLLFALAGVPARAPPPDGVVAVVAMVQWLAYGLVLAWAWRMLRPRAGTPAGRWRARR